MHAINAPLFDARGRTSLVVDGRLNMPTGGERDRSTNTAEQYGKFLDVLDAHPNAVALFTGHLHSKVGADDPVTTKAGKLIPVFFSGSAEENRYLKVVFRPTRMTVVPISSRKGDIRYFGGPPGASGRPTQLEWEVSFRGAHVAGGSRRSDRV